MSELLGLPKGYLNKHYSDSLEKLFKDLDNASTTETLIEFIIKRFTIKKKASEIFNEEFLKVNPHLLNSKNIYFTFET